MIFAEKTNQILVIAKNAASYKTLLEKSEAKLKKCIPAQGKCALEHASLLQEVKEFTKQLADVTDAIKNGAVSKDVAEKATILNDNLMEDSAKSVLPQKLKTKVDEFVKRCCKRSRDDGTMGSDMGMGGPGTLPKDDPKPKKTGPDIGL